MTQSAPAYGNQKSFLRDAAGIGKPYLSQIETGKRKGTLAKVLKVTLEEVIAREAE